MSAPEVPSARSSSPKNMEIEYLRGVAVSLAILTHLVFLLPWHEKFLLRFYSIVAMPGTGVDLFFCISGFVVSQAFVDWFDGFREKGKFALSLQVFWIRRFFRLTPTALFWVAVGTLCAAFFNQTGVFGSVFENLRSAMAVVTGCGNFANHYGLLLHPNDTYWSLALEQQFYLAFPFLLAAIPKRWRAACFFAGIALQFPIDRNIHIAAPAGNEFMASLRTDSILWGILVFLFSRTAYHRQFEPVFLKDSRVAGFAAPALLFYLLVAMPAQFPLIPVTMGMVAAVAAVIVWLASYRQDYVVPSPALGKLFAWIGARSYGIYIIHVLSYRLTFEAWSRYADARGVALGVADTLPMLATAATTLLVFAQLNYHLIEIPFRNRGIRIAEQRLRDFAA